MTDRIKKNMRYISFRMEILGALTLLLLLVILLVPESGSGILMKKTLLLAAVLLLLVFAWFFLFIPCRNYADQNRRFTEGYITISELLLSPVMYSPSSESMLRQLDHVLCPDGSDMCDDGDTPVHLLQDRLERAFPFLQIQQKCLS